MTEPNKLPDEMVAAYAFVDAMVPRADGGGPVPWWYGWALREAYLAGVQAERERCERIAMAVGDVYNISFCIARRIREGTP